MSFDCRGRGGRFSRLLLVLNLLVAAAWLPVPAAYAAPGGLQAPEGTTQMWVDVESQAARTGVESISWRAGSSTWAVIGLSPTVFGVTGSAPASPGELELRISPAERFSADVVVSFADAAGSILAEHRLRDAPFEPNRTLEGWITWDDLVAGHMPSPAPGGNPDKQPNNHEAPAPASTATAPGIPPKALGATGAAGPLLVGILAAGVLAAGTGTALLLRQRRLQAVAALHAGQQGETR